MKKITIILPGGGIRGVFQLAFLKTLFDSDAGKNIEIKNVYGTSVGALLAPFVITKKFDKGIEFLNSINSINDLAVKWNYTFIPGIGSLINYYYLYKYKAYYKKLNLKVLDELEKEINEDQNREELMNKIKYNMFVTAVNLNNGKEEFLSGENWKDNIEASASLWLAFPPKKIGESFYIDGGLTERYPLQIINDSGNNNDDPDHHYLILNFTDTPGKIGKKDVTDMNVLDFSNRLINISGEKHVENDYNNFKKYINSIEKENHVHIYCCDTYFKHALEIDKKKIESAFIEGSQKADLFINKINYL